MNKKDEFKKGEIIIYRDKNGPEIKVNLDKETVWLDAHQIAALFEVNRPAVVKHVGNIYKESELSRELTCSVLEQVAADGKIRKMNLYNLDMIISIGYRVNSKRATQFRIWATKTLKDHLVKGYTINTKRLREERNKFNELRSAIAFIEEKSRTDRLQGQEREILDLIGSYAKTLSILEKYDKGKLKAPKGKKAEFVLKYDDCLGIVRGLKKELMAKKEAGDIFGNEIDKKFESVMGTLYQTFEGNELYRTIDEKAANLLYLVAKGHVFSDGNKRIGAFLFIYFLDKNNYLCRETGEKKINDNALTALTLLVAESNPKEKDIIIKIILNLI